MNIQKSYYALSDENRLKILKLLMDYGELCVCQLIPALNISQPNLSFHLKILREVNFVKTRKEGKWIYYTLNLSNPILRANLQFIKLIKVKDAGRNCEI